MNILKKKWIDASTLGGIYVTPPGFFDEDRRDFSILKEFTDEELAQELLRRTELGKELE
jgi:hypothetical protein